MTIIKDDGSFVFNISKCEHFLGEGMKHVGDEIFVYGIGKYGGQIHHKVSIPVEDIVFIIEE